MQRRPVLARVDCIAPEEPLHFIADAAFARESHQQPHGFGIDQVFGIVEQDTVVAQRKILEALRIGGEHLCHVRAGHGELVLFERQPCG